MSRATSKHDESTVEDRRRRQTYNWLTNRAERFAARLPKLKAELDEAKTAYEKAPARSRERGRLARAQKSISRQMKRTASRRRWCERQIRAFDEQNEAEAVIARNTAPRPMVDPSVAMAVADALNEFGIKGLLSRGKLKKTEKGRLTRA